MAIACSAIAEAGALVVRALLCYFKWCVIDLLVCQHNYVAVHSQLQFLIQVGHDLSLYGRSGESWNE